jgi:hypothetical protein
MTDQMFLQIGRRSVFAQHRRPPRDRTVRGPASRGRRILSGIGFAARRLFLAELNGENSRADVQNIREDSWVFNLFKELV